MSTHKHFDKICWIILCVTLVVTVLFINAERFGVDKQATIMGYEKKLFETSTVHNMDIIMDDWDEFIDSCETEEYYNCTVVIDNEAYKNVAIRGKGNTSLTQVKSYGNDRYSFKIEFDHFDDTNNYYGLDKLCLNNIIQDNTYMKDYLTYQMMNEMGVASPLCSYVYITVNGEDWGLYLAVEGIEDSFLKRNYGNNYGELYKPDSMNMGGGRGNGGKFDMDSFIKDNQQSENPLEDTTEELQEEIQEGMSEGMQGQRPGGIPKGMQGQRPEGIPEGMQGQRPERMPEGMQGQRPEGMPEGMQGQKPEGMKNASADVLLKYIDDEIQSYSNIFDNAKTDITDSDKIRLINSLKKLLNREELADIIDIESVIRYFVVHNFVLNFDSYTGSMIHNYYLYEKDGQMQMIPWDYNLAFGGFQSMGDSTELVNYPIDSPVSGGNMEDRPMLSWIFENEEYTKLYHQYFSEFIDIYFENGYFENMIDNIKKMISPYVEKDPTKFCTFEEFEKGISTLCEFCILRAESVSDQLNGTISATSENRESDTLVDAGDLQISDMGSMENFMGGMKRQN